MRIIAARFVQAIAPALVAGVIAMGVGSAAQAQDIVMATFGGGVETTWEGAFATPFAKSTGHSVKIVAVPTPEAQVRGQAGNPQYNVAVVTYPQGANLLKDGLIETLDMADVPVVAETNPAYLMKAPNNKLAGVSPYFMYYGIAINTDQAKKSDFTSWSDLANPKWKDKLALTRPIYLATYDLTIMAISAGGNENKIEPGVELLRRTAKNALTLYSSMAHMNSLLTRGEVAVGPYYSGRVWQLRREGAKNVDMVIPKEGALMIPYIVVVPKGAKNFNIVKKWLNYIAMAEPQLRAMALGGYFPLNAKAKLPAEVEKEMGTSLEALMPRLHQPDWAVISAAEKDRINMIEKMLASTK